MGLKTLGFVGAAAMGSAMGAPTHQALPVQVVAVSSISTSNQARAPAPKVIAINTGENNRAHDVQSPQTLLGDALRTDNIIEASILEDVLRNKTTPWEMVLGLLTNPAVVIMTVGGGIFVYRFLNRNK